ncbi:hypothetical protein DUNSADRAFT_11698 [Dunaliella salina]|uniref:Encoded protein n=1 Tax=Dunaliella salina TaxID=3046 RepID=A0ABQ7H4F5_DUNSA|nr:hypothetical protein DUNSADRAFT_11698 [Dunaliella salina]|eukprot:KAF5841724.1 hypothetical protein DUNSADRAFT_11698 [Dunaliella salina]
MRLLNKEKSSTSVVCPDLRPSTSLVSAPLSVSGHETLYALNRNARIWSNDHNRGCQPPHGCGAFASVTDSVSDDSSHSDHRDRQCFICDVISVLRIAGASGQSTKRVQISSTKAMENDISCRGYNKMLQYEGKQVKRKEKLQRQKNSPHKQLMIRRRIGSKELGRKGGGHQRQADQRRSDGGCAKGAQTRCCSTQAHQSGIAGEGCPCAAHKVKLEHRGQGNQPRCTNPICRLDFKCFLMVLFLQLHLCWFLTFHPAHVHKHDPVHFRAT